MVFPKQYTWMIRMAMAWNCIGTGPRKVGLVTRKETCKWSVIHWILKACSKKPKISNPDRCSLPSWRMNCLIEDSGSHFLFGDPVVYSILCARSLCCPIPLKKYGELMYDPAEGQGKIMVF